MSIPFELLPDLVGPALRTIEITLLSASVALAFALVAGVARASSFLPIRAITGLYVEVFRGTSAIVQIFFFFYVLPLFGVPLSPLAAGVLALGLNFGAYGSEVVRAAILNVPTGQREAASALGMSQWMTMRRIVLPQAFVMMLPPFGNLSVELLKGTALVSLITVTDLTFAGQQEIIAGSDASGTYLLILLIYFALALPLMAFARAMERRAGRGQQLGRRA